MAQPARPIRPAAIVQPARTDDAQDRTRAACHPHLMSHPAAVPSINADGVPAPGSGRVRVLLWIDGRGRVTRSILTDAAFVTPEERRAALDYAARLTFSVPETPECSSQQLELWADYFKRQSPSGQWQTFVSAYPRLALAVDGSVLRRD